MRNALTTALLFFTFSLSLDAQLETVGLLFNEGDASDGYTLFTPGANNKAYLIDNCGQLINQWTFLERPGLTSYLLENGTHLHAGTDSLEIRDWNNTLLWSFETGSLGANQHHDIEPLPNGNILLVYSDNYTTSEAIAQGKDSLVMLGTTQFQLDQIIEIQPMGTSGAQVVWEWKFMDHLIQDHDPSKPNFGVITDHPELLDINFEGENIQDFTHLNAVDYNSELDQIMISARHTNEIYIIDHSTTLAEAASHTGGNSGKGGDFLWRWGNPQAYGIGDDTDKRLGRQHDCKWIEEGIHQGKISVFNNNGYDVISGSTVHVIEPNETNGTYAMSNGMFEPTDYLWSWGGMIQGELMEESFKCGVQILPNGNALISETTKGKLSEVTPSGDIVWVYEIPHGLDLFNQFEIPNANGSFRAHRYPSDFQGFNGLSLTPTQTIENENAITDTCAFYATLSEVEIQTSFYPNPVHEKLTINTTDEIRSVSIFNAIGQVIYNGQRDIINVQHVTPGIYFITIKTKWGETTKRFVKN